MHNDHEEIVSRKTMENNCPEPPTNHHQPAIYAKNAQSLSQATFNALLWKREHDWNHSFELNGLQLFAVQFQEVEIGIGILRESHSLAGNKMNQTGPLLATVRHHPESDGDSSPDPCAEKKSLTEREVDPTRLFDSLALRKHPIASSVRPAN